MNYNFKYDKFNKINSNMLVEQIKLILATKQLQNMTTDKI